nr:MAG TPA: hypothetical protein [Caudoviricetes sp.]
MFSGSRPRVPAPITPAPRRILCIIKARISPSFINSI